MEFSISNDYNLRADGKVGKNKFAYKKSEQAYYKHFLPNNLYKKYIDKEGNFTEYIKGMNTQDILNKLENEVPNLAGKTEFIEHFLQEVSKSKNRAKTIDFRNLNMKSSFNYSSADEKLANLAHLDKNLIQVYGLDKFRKMAFAKVAGIENYDALTRDQLIKEAVKNNGIIISCLKEEELSIELCEIAIKQNPYNLRFISNFVEKNHPKLKKLAFGRIAGIIDQNILSSMSFDKIIIKAAEKDFILTLTLLNNLNYNISGQVKMDILKNNGFAISLIKNATDAMKIIALNQNGFALQYLNASSEEMKKIAFAQIANISNYNDYALDQLQLMAISKNPKAISLIENPNIALQKAALGKDPFTIKNIKHPSKEIAFFAFNSLNEKYSLTREQKIYFKKYFKEPYQPLDIKMAQFLFHNKDKKYAVVVVDMNQAFVNPYQKQINKTASVLENASPKIPIIIVGYSSIGQTHKDILPKSGFEFSAKENLDKDQYYYLYKTSISTFQSSMLHEHLQEQGITDLILIGANRDVCVKSTAEDALKLGYNITTAPDLLIEVGYNFQGVSDFYYQNGTVVNDATELAK
ncbi:MAG: isochorismatase family protein [Candidatus Margulisbacteria bacterium]|nr:isochorismatase family protein [Candidatus Margulisiibacteriota bacterium]